MSPKSCFIICFVLINTSSFGQLKKKKLTASVIWEVKAPQSRQVSFLMGSIHPLRCDSVLSKFDTLFKLIGNCRLFACETMAFKDSVETQKYINAFSKLAPKNFTGWFGRDSALVDNFFLQAFGFKEAPSVIFARESLLDQTADVQTMSKMLTDSVLSLAGLHPVPTPNFDYCISDAVQKGGFPILQLDDAGFLTENFLTKTEYAEEIVQYIRLLKKYQKGGHGALEKDRSNFFTSMMKKYYNDATFEYNLKEKPNDQSVIERNKNWINKLVPELKQGNVFILVGIGHLIGKNYGLIPDLQKKGFIVTPVNLKPVNSNN